MRTLNGKILINDKGELNEQTWLENCIAVGELLAERTRRSTTDGLIDLAVVEADRKTGNSSEKPNNCEPQTIRCPKCGRTDYIRDMEKDMGIKGSHYKYKCINCNFYIKTEPTSSKMEQVDKDINVRSKEPQTVVRLKHFKCPKCGRSDYIRSFEDWGIDGGIYKYKCINCNTYIKDEPQTEREGER